MLVRLLGNCSFHPSALAQLILTLLPTGGSLSVFHTSVKRCKTVNVKPFLKVLTPSFDFKTDVLTKPIFDIAREPSYLSRDEFGDAGGRWRYSTVQYSTVASFGFPPLPRILNAVQGGSSYLNFQEKASPVVLTRTDRKGPKTKLSESLVSTYETHSFAVW